MDSAVREILSYRQREQYFHIRMTHLCKNISALLLSLAQHMIQTVTTTGSVREASLSFSVLKAFNSTKES